MWVGEWMNDWNLLTNQLVHWTGPNKDLSFTVISSWWGNASLCDHWWWTFPVMHAIKGTLCKTYINAEHWHESEGVKHKKTKILVLSWFLPCYFYFFVADWTINTLWNSKPSTFPTVKHTANCCSACIASSSVVPADGIDNNRNCNTNFKQLHKTLL